MAVSEAPEKKGEDKQTIPVPQVFVVGEDNDEITRHEEFDLKYKDFYEQFKQVTTTEPKINQLPRIGPIEIQNSEKIAFGQNGEFEKLMVKA